MFGRRDMALIGAIALTVLGAIVIWFGAAAVLDSIFGRHAPAAAPWLALAKAASLAWVAGVGWAVAWPRLDEMAREVRKLSWFVGSTAAILVTAPIMLFCLLSGGGFLARFAIAHGAPGVYFAMGWGGLVIAQLLGALVARVGWWLAKR